MYPESDMKGAARRLQMFLEQYWGGPTTYQAERGHPRLRMRHAGFHINPAARDAWMSCMKAAVEGMEMEAEAKGLFEILTKQAEGYKEVVAAAGGDPNKAFQLLLIEKLPELVKIQVEAVKNIKIDKITVWDSAANGDGNTSTANFVSGMMKTVPPLNDLFNMAGLNLPTYLKGEEEKGGSGH